VSRSVIIATVLFVLAYTASFYFRIYVVDTPVGGEEGSAILAALRQAVLWGQLSGAWGMASLAAGALVFLLGGRATLCAWSALTALALSNYNVDLGVLGLVLGVLRLVRL